MQMPRYEQDLEKAQKLESQEYTLAQLEEMCYEHKTKITKADTKKADSVYIMTVLEDEYGIQISRWKARQVGKRLVFHFPDEFE